ncbi:VanZ family protein [Mucilaginibacter sp. BJC16-A38]|uniref:VanZ family protein n=1 Tax=Mucilaginibacter phenanthrenivorans TaxID=1234842 RepID=UPI0021588CBF|nr:VanZ family protein [Mucilaginibacter phenanthrenivorans]MCR8559338.1 VanZ family protein [Mucilaginibacter phenanthrenivorans]
MCTAKLGEISESPLFFPGFDKLVHCGFFFVMIVFIAAGYIRQQSAYTVSYKTLLLITIIAIVYGGLIEILQKYFFTWRSAEWNDLFADVIGTLMAAFSIFITVNALSYEKK